MDNAENLKSFTEWHAQRFYETLNDIILKKVGLDNEYTVTTTVAKRKIKVG